MLSRSGNFNCRLEIQQRSRTSTNTAGEPVYSWLSIGHAWAQAIPTNATEYTRGMQVAEDVTELFRIRRQPSLAITPEMRVVLWPDSTLPRTLEIAGAYDVDEQRETILLHCRECVA